MLTDDQLSLVSAAVDRELTPAQVGTFRTLVQTSPEAAQLFRQFTEQSARLSKLPRRAAPPDLRSAVLARIDPPAVRPAESRLLVRWLPYAMAASALAAVTAGAWLATRPAAGPAFVEVVTPPEPKSSEVTRPAPQPEQPAIPPVVPPQPSSEIAPVPKVVINTPPPKPLVRRGTSIPEPDEPAPNLHGAPVFTPPPLAQVDAQLPFLAALADLEMPDPQSKLIAELGRDGPFRLDLFVRDPLRGVQALLAVAKQAGLTAAVDPVARDRIARKQPTQAFAVYTDSLSADETAKLLAALAAFDRRPDQGLYGQAHLVPMRDADRKDVRELLGADPDAPRRPRDKAADALKVKAGEKTGILVVYLPATLRANPMTSKEVRDYLARRDDRKPGAVSLLLTVRAAMP